MVLNKLIKFYLEINYDNIDKSKFGLFYIIPVMAYIYVYDCQAKSDEISIILEELKLYALAQKKEFENNIEDDSKKPLQFFIANKYPFYVKETTININDKDNSNLSNIDVNIKKFQQNLIELKLIDE